MPLSLFPRQTKLIYQLIILSGYPCSGLTHRANQLQTALNQTQDELLSHSPSALKTRYKIHIVPTHDASHPRTVYDNARTEKEARGVAYTRARRALGKDSIVILDGMNYIKGYRYQLYCEANELKTTSCVVGFFSFFCFSFLFFFCGVLFCFVLLFGMV